MTGRFSKEAALEERRFLLDFVKQSDLSEELSRDHLRMLWTSLCLHQGLDADTAAYDNLLLEVREVIDEHDTGDWDIDTDQFENFMARYLV